MRRAYESVRRRKEPILATSRKNNEKNNLGGLRLMFFTSLTREVQRIAGHSIRDKIRKNHELIFIVSVKSAKEEPLRPD